MLYHLRHPVLALDNLRRLTRETAFLETAVADADVGDQAGLPFTLFYRADGRAGDGSNWFFPIVRCLLDWCSSSGLAATRVTSWPEPIPKRAALELRPERPEYIQWTGERARCRSQR